MRTGSGKDGPIISDNGNIVMDCDFGTIDNPAMLSDELSRIPGLVEHGIFTKSDGLTLAMMITWKRGTDGNRLLKSEFIMGKFAISG